MFMFLLLGWEACLVDSDLQTAKKPIQVDNFENILTLTPCHAMLCHVRCYRSSFDQLRPWRPIMTVCTNVFSPAAKREYWLECSMISDESCGQPTFCILQWAVTYPSKYHLYMIYQWQCLWEHTQTLVLRVPSARKVLYPSTALLWAKGVQRSSLFKYR